MKKVRKFLDGWFYGIYGVILVAMMHVSFNAKFLIICTVFGMYLIAGEINRHRLEIKRKHNLEDYYENEIFKLNEELNKLKSNK